MEDVPTYFYVFEMFSFPVSMLARWRLPIFHIFCLPVCNILTLKLVWNLIFSGFLTSKDKIIPLKITMQKFVCGDQCWSLGHIIRDRDETETSVIRDRDRDRDHPFQDHPRPRRDRDLSHPRPRPRPRPNFINYMVEH